MAKTIAEKAVTANIIPQSRIYSKKILEYLSKNNYTTVLNLFFELTDSSKYSIFRYHHALHGQLILHQMSQHLATLQTSLFQMAQL